MMNIPTAYQKVPGLIMAVVSAIFWGVSGTCAQFLFEEKSLDPGWLVCWRLVLGGVLLLIFSLSQKKRDTFQVWKKPIDAFQIILFGILGMVAVQFTYFYSISLSNAATATILQYLGPVLIVAFFAIKNRRLPNWTEYTALFMALAGTFLLVTHGSFDSLVISDEALIWGLLSALALAFYTIFPVSLLRKFSPATITGWGMLVGGLVMIPIMKPWEIQGIWDLETFLAFAYIILFGTVLAFYLFLSSVTIIGATNASLLCSVEPLAAAGTAVVWLGVYFGIMDWIGTIFIFLTVVILSLTSRGKKTS
ncbi:DMT family transporter [Algoriphagus marinus]|uniref:DMT family transporter n=1 Tax=Algoriphagus marinus TaxID=1925762 RepID=UPI000AF55A1A|nr:EamA family transporter [Algoriphagus marinus]